MVESLLGEFPLRYWRTYLLTCLIMEISDRDPKSAFFKLFKYKRKRVVSLDHCIEKIMISKEIRYENTIHDVLLESDQSCPTMKWYIVSLLDHVAKEIVLKSEVIALFESEFHARETVYCEYRRHRTDSKLEELCQ